MTATSRPLLHNGYALPDGVTVLRRADSVFFTDIYDMSNGKFLYLFRDLAGRTIASKALAAQTFTLTVNGAPYLAMTVDQHTRENVARKIDALTSIRGLDSVAGMKNLKNMLISEVIGPLRDPEKYTRFKLSIPNGILLYGPPGCGKTFVVKKLAEELSYAFFELSPSSVATPWVHGAVGNIAKMFDMAKADAPAIVFIDEIEGLIPRRDDLGGHADIKKEEINEFLLQLNRASDARILVVGATNRPMMIDSALLRSGRMDKRIYVSPPDFEARLEMFKLCLAGRPHDEAMDFAALASRTNNFVGSDIELIVTQAARTAVARNAERVEQQMLIDQIAGFTPSISVTEIEQFERLSGLERW